MTTPDQESATLEPSQIIHDFGVEIARRRRLQETAERSAVTLHAALAEAIHRLAAVDRNDTETNTQTRDLLLVLDHPDTAPLLWKELPPVPAGWTPVDLDICQAVAKSYHPFIMGGNVHRETRCTTEPTMVLVEVEADAEGRRGAMAVCDPCYEQYQKQGGPAVTVTRL